MSILLLILFGVAGQAWLDRIRTTSWKSTLWVGVFPVNGDGSPMAQKYIENLTEPQFGDIESFFQREAHRYGQDLSAPVHVALYRPPTRLPPELPVTAGVLDTMWWSLKLRWYASSATDYGGKPTPTIRMFILYHDPTTLPTVPDSHGLQKGLLGGVHVFAAPSMAGSNSIVISHELLHILGATDKYEPGTGLPIFPAGFAEPDRTPRYPQPRAEVMAGQRAISATEAEMPASLRDVVVGPATAAEVRWTH